MNQQQSQNEPPQPPSNRSSEASSPPQPPVSSRILKTENVNWREFKFIQNEDFKGWKDDDKHKLKASVLADNFIQPFYVWEDQEGQLWCLDGKHRSLIMEELLKEGHGIPYLLPATFIQCTDKKEAAKLVLKYSSTYAKVTVDGLQNFLKEHQLEFKEVKFEISLPDFSAARFEQKVDIFGTGRAPEDAAPQAAAADTDAPVVVKKGDFFQLGRHKLLCGDFMTPGNMDLLMAGAKARIVNTDPPYNLAAAEFTNKGKTKHKNFAMGAGEMTDDEFVDFLGNIMRTACDHSVDGAIHYIFMDFRHAWHMTEAARRVYGSPEPKQVCVWKKDLFANGSFYRAQHEFCFIFKSGNAKHLSHLELKDRIRSNVWEYPSATSLSNPDRDQLAKHCTPKNVQMIADSIQDTTNENDIVIDFFGGSGTTIMAAEMTNRICHCTEIEPQYVQNIIQRYLLNCRKRNVEPAFQHLNGNLQISDFE